MDVHYCVAAGLVPEELRSRVLECEARWIEWRALGCVDEDESCLLAAKRLPRGAAFWSATEASFWTRGTLTRDSSTPCSHALEGPIPPPLSARERQTTSGPINPSCQPFAKARQIQKIASPSQES